MKNKNFTVIKCPKCGYEYLPAEIFLPDVLLGKPNDILRDEKGRIEYFGGESISLQEEFTCENCDVHFKVNADISFKCEYDSKIDFDEDYETTIYKNRIKLEEPV